MGFNLKKFVSSVLSPVGGLELGANTQRELGIDDPLSRAIDRGVDSRLASRDKTVPGTGVRVKDFQEVGINAKSSISVWNDMMGNVSGTGNLADQRERHDTQAAKEAAAETARLQGEAQAEQLRLRADQQRSNSLALEGTRNTDLADVEVGGSADVSLGVGTAAGRRRRNGGMGVTVGL